jgi:polysaccharide export outer membrane protein
MKAFPLALLFAASWLLVVPAMADSIGGSAPKQLAVADGLPPARQIMRSPYRIQPGDVLNISVWKETDLTTDVIVRPDGGVSFPLAGDQVAEGRTVEELRGLLAEQLKKFIPDPVVTVAVKQLNGNRIFVIGKVQRPGDFPYSKPLDVMQSLTLAGGTTSFADLNDIRILRREDDGKQVVIPFRYDDVSRGRHLEQNVLLRSGDTVVVP